MGTRVQAPIYWAMNYWPPSHLAVGGSSPLSAATRPSRLVSGMENLLVRGRVPCEARTDTSSATACARPGHPKTGIREWVEAIARGASPATGKWEDVATPG